MKWCDTIWSRSKDLLKATYVGVDFASFEYMFPAVQDVISNALSTCYRQDVTSNVSITNSPSGSSSCKTQVSEVFDAIERSLNDTKDHKVKALRPLSELVHSGVCFNSSQKCETILGAVAYHVFQVTSDDDQGASKYMLRRLLNSFVGSCMLETEASCVSYLPQLQKRINSRQVNKWGFTDLAFNLRGARTIAEAFAMCIAPSTNTIPRCKELANLLPGMVNKVISLSNPQEIERRIGELNKKIQNLMMVCSGKQYALYKTQLTCIIYP
eukprot:TRINITY_DN535_c0_g1_i2.p1 TRINITY_DN535_c0_g1~~TRINITY_DN535_c0_g1_i2.p1  ORF type:complete len:269 (+),score=31.01 TRINITY_DN535_c0_g1_i2:328-1134(+)